MVTNASKKPSLAKMVTAAGFQLKGSGWYATDFKSKGSTPKPDAKPEGKSGGGSTEGGGGADGGKQAAGACGANCGCH